MSSFLYYCYIIHPSDHPSFNPSIHLSYHVRSLLSDHPFFHVSIHKFIDPPFIHSSVLPFHPSIHSFVHFPIYSLLISLSVFCPSSPVLFMYFPTCLLVDIDVPQPDKKLIMMYLTSMYDGLKNHAPTRDRKNKKIQV